MLSAFVHRLLNKEKQGWANRDRGIKASMSWDMPSEDQPNNVKNSLHTHTDSNFLNNIVMAGMIAYILIFIVYDQFFRLDDQKKNVPRCDAMNCGCWHIARSVFHGGDLGSVAFHTGIFCADFDLQIVI